MEPCLWQLEEVTELEEASHVVKFSELRRDWVDELSILLSKT